LTAVRPQKKHSAADDSGKPKGKNTLFAWLISHQPVVLFSQNKPASSTFLSKQISASHRHQPNEQAEKRYGITHGPFCVPALIFFSFSENILSSQNTTTMVPHGIRGKPHGPRRLQVLQRPNVVALQPP
jgi:hypothetical protein